MKPVSLIRCSCCGYLIEWENRIDIGFQLPDPARDLPQDTIHRPAKAFVKASGIGRFLRCLLNVTLSGDVELALGVWIQISSPDYKHCRRIWEEDEYASLTVHGTLANGIEPWAAAFGANVTAVVQDPDHLPVIVDSSDPLVIQMLSEAWDRDEVLGHFAFALPIPVRESLSRGWGIERSAGLAWTTEDRTLVFTGPGRSVSVDVFGDRDDRPQDQFLRELLAFAPGVPPDHEYTDHTDGVLRHAFWRVVDADGQPEHQFYGQIVANGSAVWLVCVYDDPTDHDWAWHVFRSVSPGGN
ncbi:DUF2199 domain-containing protein [Mycobacterium sp. NPDC050853]|uniref:DUF2199 domain-containing protein n=1 Tax=Mycobacterium sp. NPDC050853 TaxID=3155160 RepID=UPI0033F9D0A6